MEAKRKCPTCREGELVDGTTEHTSKAGERVFVATLPSRNCSRCDEAIVSGEHLRAFEVARARALVAAGASDGAALRWVRKAAGLTGVELARLLGIAPETVSRWEHGTQSPDRATVALVGAMATEALDGAAPTTRQRLDALALASASPAPTAPVVLSMPARAA